MKGRNRIWIEGDDVKMWQLRSGLLNRCESGAFVWRDEWILAPSSPLPVLPSVGRRTEEVDDHERLPSAAFFFPCEYDPFFPSPGPPSWTYNHHLYVRPFFLPCIYLSYPLRISSSPPPQAPPLPQFPCSQQILPLPFQYIHPQVKK